MNQNELKSILDEHKKYLTGIGGKIANLRGADLRGADLSGAKGIISIGPIGSRGDMLYAVQHDTGPMLKTGCFWGTLAEFESALEKTHGDGSTGSPEHARAYRAALALVRSVMPVPETAC